MILLSGLHCHKTVTTAAADCVECAHHVHHSGHFTIAPDHIDDCVLCQFLSLVYTAATATILVLFVNFTQKGRLFLCNCSTQKEPSLLCTRAPPAIL